MNIEIKLPPSLVVSRSIGRVYTNQDVYDILTCHAWNRLDFHIKNKKEKKLAYSIYKKHISSNDGSFVAEFEEFDENKVIIRFLDFYVEIDTISHRGFFKCIKTCNISREGKEIGQLILTIPFPFGKVRLNVESEQMLSEESLMLACLYWVCEKHKWKNS